MDLKMEHACSHHYHASLLKIINKTGSLFRGLEHTQPAPSISRGTLSHGLNRSTSRYLKRNVMCASGV
jgi:hypothetical protein